MLEKEETKTTIERQTAKIASIKGITTGRYLRQEGWSPNYVLTKKNEKITRVNLMGVVVTVPDTADSLFIDDGTGKIEVRSFENSNMFKDITIGDIVLIIGRPREFNNELYLNSEIIKKISNKGWLEYRKKEILLKNIRMPDVEQEPLNLEEDLNIEKEAKIEKEMNRVEEIIFKIKELDKGTGCDIQAIISKDPNAEEIIQNLLLKGEIFEITPGKVKILE